MASTSSDSVFTKIPDIGYTETAPEVSFEEFKKVVESRRSVRVFEKGVAIPEQVVRDCLSIALLAPNSSNLQTWKFFWVRSPEKKKALVEACLSQPAASTAAELIVCVAEPSLWKKNAKKMLEVFDKNLIATGKDVPVTARSYYKNLVPLAYNQGPLNLFGSFKALFMFLKGISTPIPREPVNQSDMKLWAAKSSALGCENLMLAFRAAGFDSCPMEGMDSVRVRKILGLSRKSHITMVISAGKRAKNGVYGPRVRFPAEEFLFEV